MQFLINFNKLKKDLRKIITYSLDRKERSKAFARRCSQKKKKNGKTRKKREKRDRI